MTVNQERNAPDVLVYPPTHTSSTQKIPPLGNSQPGQLVINIVDRWEANSVLKDTVSSPYRIQFRDEVATSCNSLSRHKPSSQFSENSLLLGPSLQISEAQLFCVPLRMILAVCRYYLVLDWLLKFLLNLAIYLPQNNRQWKQAVFNYLLICFLACFPMLRTWSLMNEPKMTSVCFSCVTDFQMPC